MGPNNLMHPRNIYKTPPDFKQLAINYPEFRQHATQDLTGKVLLNFKDPSALRALTRTLLRKDFNLDVEIPADRLIPTVPQRLNYILWVEDLLQQLQSSLVRKGIDIGTGASCIFPLVGSRKNGWQFLATETNQDSFECAKRNVQKNLLTEKVKVLLVPESSMLQDVLSDDDAFPMDFCMCNPPFFCDNFDANWEAKARKTNRREPKGANTASPQEQITQGGEVEFVKRIIADSLILKEKIRIYTTMLGKKASLALIKAELRDKQVQHYVTTEFQQGKTLRWGVAWTFIPNLKLTKICFPKTTKPVRPLSFFIQSTIKNVDYTVFGIVGRIVELLKELKILYHVYDKKEMKSKLWMRSNTDTWSHQRRKKRELKRQQNSTTTASRTNGLGDAVCTLMEEEQNEKDVSLGASNSTSASMEEDQIERELVNLGMSDTSMEEDQKDKDLVNCRMNDSGSSAMEEDHPKRELSPDSSETEEVEAQSSKKFRGRPAQETKTWLLWADITVILSGMCIMLEFRPRREMESRETLHQIMQYFKNKLV